MSGGERGGGKRRHGGGQPSRPHGRRPLVGAGLPLDKFAAAKQTKYDKKAVLEKQRLQNLNVIKRYSKIKKRLARQGLLPDAQPAAPAAAAAAGDATLHDAAGPSADGGKDGEGNDERGADVAKRGRGELPSTSAPSGGSYGRSGSGQDDPSRRHAGGGSGGDKKQRSHAGSKRPRPEQASSEGDSEEGGRGGSEDKRGKRDEGEKTNKKQAMAPQGKSQLRHLADKVQAERQVEHQRRDAAAAERAARQQQLEAAHNARQRERSKFFKRNARGQPVMKHRIDKILDVLQREKAQTQPQSPQYR